MTSRLHKLKSDNIKIEGKHKLLIEPDSKKDSGTKVFKNFALQNLKIKLPKVIVKGIPTVNRAVVNKEEMNDGSLR